MRLLRTKAVRHLYGLKQSGSCNVLVEAITQRAGAQGTPALRDIRHLVNWITRSNIYSQLSCTVLHRESLAEILESNSERIKNPQSVSTYRSWLRLRLCSRELDFRSDAFRWSTCPAFFGRLSASHDSPSRLNRYFRPSKRTPAGLVLR